MNATRVSVRSFSGFCLFALALFLASCGGGGGGGGGDVPTYTVGGAVSGLTGSVTLQNNGGNNLTVSADSAFTFSTAIANAGAYNVTVLNQPVGPKCSVSNGSGAISGANVSNVAVACVNNLFQLLDHNGVGVPGVNVYLDGGAAPIGATDVTGSMQFNLTGVHSVDFHKAGRRAFSIVNRDWTAVSGAVTRQMPPYPDVATTGTVSGTISNTVNGEQIRVQLRRSSDGFASRSFPVATGTSTPYNLSAAAGTSDLFVFPNLINFSAGSSFIGYIPGVAVPAAGVNPSLLRGAATSFAVTGAGGFASGSIAVRYGVPINRFAFSELFTLTSASTSGATLAATTVNVPPFDLVYKNASYSLTVRAFSVPSTFGNPTGANFQMREERRIFPTYADMAAAANTQDIVLTNDALLALSPAHNATNVPVSPTFTWSRDGSPDYVEVQLFEYDPVRLFYAKPVWFAQVYGNTLTVTPPATLITLNANSSYLYTLYARRGLTDGAGVLPARQRNGWEDVKFSTGATPPP